MKKEKMLQCKNANEILITELLAKCGFKPQKETLDEFWYQSPLRGETKASFKVCKHDNVWYDHGMGEGGRTIDLVIRMHDNCSVKEALRILSTNLSSFSFQQQDVLKVSSEKGAIKVISESKIEHPGLIQYIKSRNVDLEIVLKYASEIIYQNKGKTYFSIGLKNVSEGWELNNKYFKNSTSPKDYSLICNKKNDLVITEGMFDFFSILTRHSKVEEKADIIVLNSLSFVSSILPRLKEYDKVYLFLDNDISGSKATALIQSVHKNSIDVSATYEGCKDINESLMVYNNDKRKGLSM